MIIKSAEFIKSAVKPSQYPNHNLLEIAFAGKSNTGKSSLINSLLNIKKLAKISGTPGRTRLLNFFEINNSFCFVDLPGYGYAKAPVSMRKEWGKMIEKYLISRSNLLSLILIMDIRRRNPIDEQNFIGWLKLNSIDYILALTKADKLSKNKKIEAMKYYSEKFREEKDKLILFSSKTGQGKNELWSVIEKKLQLAVPAENAGTNLVNAE